jgi:hypothetical protein
VSWSWLTFWRPPCLRRTVLVALVHGPADKDTSLEGVLWASTGAWFTLRNASAKTHGEPLRHVDGEAVIHRSNVAFFQVLPL